MGTERMAFQPDDLTEMASLKHWGSPPERAGVTELPRDVTVDCGWGRLLFGQTFGSADHLVKALHDENKNQRDLAFYVREPHVLLSRAPHALFLDPSHTFRFNLASTERLRSESKGVLVREATAEDEGAINKIYRARNMVPLAEGFLGSPAHKDCVTILVAEERSTGTLVGVTVGVDHRIAFNDPDNGSTLWALAVDKQAKMPGVGRKLVESLATHFLTAGRSFMDV